MLQDEDLMRAAIDLSRQSVRHGGGPFGAVITWKKRIVGQGTNQVTRINDPTAHAEIMAIRDACQCLDRFDLSDCEIFTSCEPCPMCLAAIYWARIPHVTFAASREDAARAGFDDHKLYEQLAKPRSERRVLMQRLMAEDALIAFHDWEMTPDRVPY